MLIAILIILMLATFRDYAITNDEWVTAIATANSSSPITRAVFIDRSVFNLDNLYLYGGLFDIVAVLRSHARPAGPIRLTALDERGDWRGGIGLCDRQPPV